MAGPSLREQLQQIAEPFVAEVVAHPFWAGLCDGSLPPESLAHFVLQDTAFLLPACGRAFAHCASIAADDAFSALLAHCAFATVESAPRLRDALGGLAPGFGVELPSGRPDIAPETHAYCSFFRACATESFAAGIGGLLPMMWFHLEVCRTLRTSGRPGSRYAAWVDVYDPGEGAWQAVRAVLGMVDGFGERCAPAERARLAEAFSLGARHEWAFADGGLRRPGWPA
ncbi:TenA family protein [Streptomyces sp. NPDC001262]|uniref:TenA family protein n=1 Tax=Streptomyces TaxID=1883 RepID=UPI003689D9EA